MMKMMRIARLPSFRTTARESPTFAVVDKASKAVAFSKLRQISENPHVETQPRESLVCQDLGPPAKITTRPRNHLEYRRAATSEPSATVAVQPHCHVKESTRGAVGQRKQQPVAQPGRQTDSGLLLEHQIRIMTF